MKRKTLLFLFIALSSSQVLMAQIKKGSIFLGGSVSITTAKYNSEFSDQDRSQAAFSFSPAVGKFVKDNLVWGGELQLAGYKNKFAYNSYQKNFIVGAGTFIRKYFPVVDRLYIFGQANFSVGYISEKSKGTGNEYNGKGYSVGISAYPGMSFAITRKVFVETGLANLVTLYYTHKKIRETSVLNTVKTNDFHFGTSLDSETGLTVGIRMII